MHDTIPPTGRLVTYEFSKAELFDCHIEPFVQLFDPYHEHRPRSATKFLLRHFRRSLVLKFAGFDSPQEALQCEAFYQFCSRLMMAMPHLAYFINFEQDQWFKSMLMASSLDGHTIQTPENFTFAITPEDWKNRLEWIKKGIIRAAEDAGWDYATDSDWLVVRKHLIG